jgi:hypothetical protein
VIKDGGKISNYYDRVLVHLIIIFIVGLISYFNTFNVPFHFDDYDYIVDNPLIKKPGFLLNPPATGEIEPSDNVVHTNKTRFIGYLSFLLNYRLHGLDVTGYHVTNLALHILNAALVYLLVITTCKTPFMLSSALKARYIALFSALLFVSHPVQTEAVTYITQRFTTLVALFYILSLFLYIQSRLQIADKRSGILYAGALVSALLAMKTKENAFTLPLAIAFYEFVFLDGSVKKRTLLLVPFLLTMFIIPLSLVDSSKPFLETVVTVPSFNIGLSGWKYLLVESRVLGTYLRLLVFPVNQNLDYDYFRFSLSFLVEMICSSVFLLFLLLSAVYAFKHFRHSRPWTRVISYGVFWYFLTISVESTIFPLADLIFEHRVYLPSAFLFIVFAWGAALLSNHFRNRKHRWILPVFAALIITVFSTATLVRNSVWKSEIRMWEDVIKKSPNKARPHHSLGFAYGDGGQIQKAIEQYRIAIRLDPYYVKPRQNLAITYYSLGLFDEARREFEDILKIAPENRETIFYLEQINRKQWGQ